MEMRSLAEFNEEPLSKELTCELEASTESIIIQTEDEFQCLEIQLLVL